MDPLTAMMMGSTVLGGLGSWFGGQNSAHASEQAAQRQSDAEERAAIRMRNSGDVYRTEQRGYADEFNPYIQGGQKATNQLYNLLGLNGADAATGARGQFQASPGVDYMMGQGVQALDRSAAARGMLGSGRQSKDLMRFGEGLGQQEWRNYIGDLSNLGNQGYSATGARTGLETQGSTGNLNANLGAEQAMFKNASTVPQGMIASQNAINSGMTGALGAANYGLGQAQGSGGGDALSKLLGNTSRGSSFGGNFQPSSSPFSFGSGGYSGMGPFLP